MDMYRLKVAQFSGYVSEHSAYHHAEQSLASTIIGMAQNYVGSNNVNLLAPLGQFGTRNQGGKDHASARYVFTCLSPITRLLFPQPDDMLLDYLKEDGQAIEPKWYAPIIPMVLVNGSEGIGTGWSTFVPNYNPRDVVDNIRRLLRDEPMQPMQPWYKGFKGTIMQTATKESGLTYTVTGIIEQLNETTLKITELPVRKWSQDYKEFLEDLMLGTGKVKEPFIKDYREHGTDTLVDFEVQISEENMAIAISEGLTKKFKLTTNISTSNMHLFDAGGTIKKYDTPEMLLEEFFHVRLGLYARRKAVQLSNLEVELLKLANKVRFILGVVKGEIVVSDRKRADLLEELRVKKFTPFPKNPKKEEPPVAGADLVDLEDAAQQEEAKNDGVRIDDYEYLLALAIGTLTFEKVEQLCTQRDKLDNEVEELRKASPKELWEKDLQAFLLQLDAQDLEEEKDEQYERSQMAKEGTQVIKRGPKSAARMASVKSGTATSTAGTKEVADIPRVESKQPPANKPTLPPVESDDDELGLNQNLAQRMAAMALRGKSPPDSEQDPGIMGLATSRTFGAGSDTDGTNVDVTAKGKEKKSTKPVINTGTGKKTAVATGEFAAVNGNASSEEEVPKKAGKGPARKTVKPKPGAAAKRNGDAEKMPSDVKKRIQKPLVAGEKPPQLKVQKLRISPFHKKSGPMHKIKDLFESHPSFEDMKDNLLVSAESVSAPNTRPVRLNRSKATYFQRHVLSSDTDAAGSSDSESSSEYEE